MSDILNQPHAERAPDPTAIACYTFGEGELAQFGRYLNRGYGGAAYDLTTRVGTPLVGQGGGVYVNNDAGSYWSRATVPVGDVDFSYTQLLQYDTAPAAWALNARNGGHQISNAAGTLRPNCALDGGATLTDLGYSITGRGPVWLDVLYDGANQIIVGNGRQAAAAAVVPNIGGAAALIIGGIGTTRGFKIYSVRRTVAQARASYVRDFARRVVWSWAPVEVGEGPAGGILTGSTPGGYATCPSGGATLQHVWRPDLSIPAGGRLALTDSGAISMRRIAIAHTRQPVFGSWDFSFEVRDPLTDDVIIGLTPLPDTDPTVAGSGSFWFRSHRVPNPWWRTEVLFENGAQIIGVDMADVIQAGDRIHVRITHEVNGDWRAYAYNSRQNSWYWRNAVGNSVATLTSNYVVMAPRGSYLFGVSKQQSEATPHEVGIKVP